MILVQPSTPSCRRWLVTCSAHGEITDGGQTTLAYGLARVQAHQAGHRDSCGPVVYIKREQRYAHDILQYTGRWEVNRLDDWEGPVVSSLEKAVAVARAVGEVVAA